MAIEIKGNYYNSVMGFTGFRPVRNDDRVDVSTQMTRAILDETESMKSLGLPWESVLFQEAPLQSKKAGELTINELLQVVQEKIKEREDA